MIRIITAFVLVAVVVAILRRRTSTGAKSAALPTANTAITRVDLRSQVLSRSIFTGMQPAGADSVRCALMDWNLGGANVATLVSFDDGTTSLYLSSGGGTLGAGVHETVRAAAARFREQAVAERGQFAPVTAYDLPSDDTTVFYLVTEGATLSSGPVANLELQEGRHPLASVAARAQQVIGEVRRASIPPNEGAV